MSECFLQLANRTRGIRSATEGVSIGTSYVGTWGTIKAPKGRFRGSVMKRNKVLGLSVSPCLNVSVMKTKPFLRISIQCSPLLC